jgi:concanavalin A-like lectin/glucanase superfamily protein/fibronectin type III domain protein
MSNSLPTTSRDAAARRISLRVAARTFRFLSGPLLGLILVTSPALAQTPQALQFDGVNDYVTFGAATSTLGASHFTIEVRFKRTGTGAVTSTGTGANAANGLINVVPLLAKGRGEADGDTRDANYFLGFRTTDNVLVADYEDVSASNNNHAITGTTTIQNNVWYHAAATYDGATFSLYLNGNLEAQVATSATPRFDSIQHASLGSALNSSGAAAGFFAGILDEARIWNVARSQQDIQSALAQEVLSGTGLLARWGLNEGVGASAGNSVANSVNGALTNGPIWTGDSPLSLATATALRFGGTNAYVNFGDPAELDLAQFTVECWFRRDATGTTTTTGTGGIPDMVPLVTKGGPEVDAGDNRDMNFALGIRNSDGVLCADFEEGAGGASPSLNHPVAGTTAIALGAWHQGAATYDGTTWRLYLDGLLEATLVVGQPVRSNSIQLAALATCMTSTGTAQGFFAGAIDEARIWNYARTQAELQTAMNSELSGSVSGLVARWGLNEDAGITVASTAGVALNGAITAANWSWAAGAPFNATPPAPPAAPTGLAASAASPTRIDLTWIDNATNETGYEVERSTNGSGGPFTPWVSLAAGTVTYSNTSLSPSTEYCYRVRAVNGAGPSAYDGPACATTAAPPTMALDFGGAGTTYASFGNPASLKLSTFTLEMWMRRDGAGVGTNTGSGGIPDAIPLIAKGRAENEAAAIDVNYLLGIRASDGVLCADFEEGTGGASPSLNHPIAGTTAITNGVWHHVAASYDATRLRLYLDGNLEAQLTVGQPPASASDVPVSLATALNSTSVAAGSFDGVVDEVRIWNVARTQAEIQSTANSQIVAPVTGLVGRWSLDEGSGTAINGSAGTAVNGVITGADYAWVGPAPFDLSFTPPAAPTELGAFALNGSQIHLSWSDNSGNETGFEIERSTTGAGGPFAPLTTRPADATNYTDTGLSPLTLYCYRIRAVNGAGASSYEGPACATTQGGSTFALDFAGSTYVTFGDPPALDLPQFTAECWFRRDGTGTIVSTGIGGIANAIPLVTKGTSENDGSNVDMNFFLGINDATDVLIADLEEGAGGASPGLNHPITGATAIANGVWHHAAATYDGASWSLYLDGALEATLAVGQPCQSQSIQPAALASSIRSNGTAQGFLDGALDEARIWSVARTQAEIQGTANAQITSPTTGLVARWGLDEGSGTVVNSSAGTTVNGSIVGANSTWISPGAPFDLAFNHPPAPPTLNGPADMASGVGLAPTLDVGVSDPDGQPLTVTYYGRALSGGTPGSDFTLIGQPDTQYYTGQVNGGTNAILLNINNWIVANRASRNIAYAATLGDCVEHGDNAGDDIEWQRADAAYDLIEDPFTTGLAEGIPYGITVGNHDQSPNGDASGTTTFYNQYFGISRFQGRAYYGGHFGTNNDNWYDLFSAGGMDFIAISFEYDTSPDQAILDWGDQLLTTYSNRRAIVLSHHLCGVGNPADFSPQGQAIYTALKGHPSLFLMLAGHVPGEGRRQDTFNGVTINTVMSDYQGRTNGGDGWIRIMTFSPANNTIEVETYSPWLNQSETDTDSRFTLSYNMSNTPAFQAIGSQAAVPSGSSSQLPWPGLLPNTTYQWYVTVSDGAATTTGPVWQFTTAVDGGPPTAEVVSPNGTELLTIGGGASLQWNATDDLGVSSVDLLLSRSGASGPFENIATGVPNTGSYAWTVSGPPTVDAFLKVVAHDYAEHSAEDLSDASFTITDGIVGVADTPLEFALNPVSPNPAARRVHVAFALPREAAVRLSVLDVQGREAAVLADGGFPAGRHALDWNGRVGGGHAPSGLYFVRMVTAGRTFIRRVVFIN